MGIAHWGDVDVKELSAFCSKDEMTDIEVDRSISVRPERLRAERSGAIKRNATNKNEHLPASVTKRLSIMR